MPPRNFHNRLKKEPTKKYIILADVQDTKSAYIVHISWLDLSKGMVRFPSKVTIPESEVMAERGDAPRKSWYQYQIHRILFESSKLNYNACWE